MRFFVLALLFFSAFSQAGEIAKGTVAEVTNIVGSEKKFGIRLKAGGSGPCAGNWMFIHSDNLDIDSYRAAFSLATAALVSGNQVRIHNYSSDDCHGATFVSIYASG